MRWSRADLEEKQEPRAATSASAERRAEGMWHDVTRKKGLDQSRDREADIRCHSISYPPSNGGIRLNLLSDFLGPPQGCSSLGGATVAVQRWYDFPEFEGYPGNANFKSYIRNIE